MACHSVVLGLKLVGGLLTRLFQTVLSYELLLPVAFA